MKNDNQKLNFILVLLISMMFFSSCNNDGRTPDTTGTDTTGNLRESREEDFVTDVLDMNAKEIAWLNAGISKGTDNELKAEAKKMLADHEKLRKELREYAQKNNIIVTDMDTTNIIDINASQAWAWLGRGMGGWSEWRPHPISEQIWTRIKEDDALKNIITSTLPVPESHRDAAKKLEDRLEPAREK